jgi:hypothetical protein
MSEGRTAALRAHPATPMPAVHAIAATVERPSADTLRLHYRLDGDPSRIRVPPAGGGAMTPHLWEHTCFEAFVAAEGEPGYREINLSPSGDWAIHDFAGYRDGAMLDDDALAPRIAVARSPRGFALDATIALGRWPAVYRAAALRVGLAAVVEGDDGTLAYWALAHAAGRPDFHRDDARLVRMPPALAAAG